MSTVTLVKEDHYVTRTFPFTHHPVSHCSLSAREGTAIFFSEVMHGEYWIRREECQIVCIIRGAKRHPDDSVMECFTTDGRVLFGEVRASVLCMQHCEWLSNCSVSCHEPRESSSHSQNSPSTILNNDNVAILGLFAPKA